MMMYRVSRRVLMTMAITTLVVGATATLALLGCGSSEGGSPSAMVGSTQDVALFPGGVEAAKLDASNHKDDSNIPGINLGTSGHFHSLSVPKNYTDNHYFMTKAGVAYQVEVIAEGNGADVDLFIGRNAHPATSGFWKRSLRYYPLMDGIVFKSTQDGIMYVDVPGYSDGGTPGNIPYHIHVRKCQFGTFNQ